MGLAWAKFLETLRVSRGVKNRLLKSHQSRDLRKMVIHGEDMAWPQRMGWQPLGHTVPAEMTCNLLSAHKSSCTSTNICETFSTSHWESCDDNANIKKKKKTLLTFVQSNTIYEVQSRVQMKKLKLGFEGLQLPREHAWAMEPGGSAHAFMRGLPPPW